MPVGGITSDELARFYNMIRVGGIIVLPLEESACTPEAVRPGRRSITNTEEKDQRMRVVAKNPHTMTLEYHAGNARLFYTPSYIKALTDMIRRFGRWGYEDGIIG